MLWHSWTKLISANPGENIIYNDHSFCIYVFWPWVRHQQVHVPWNFSNHSNYLFLKPKRFQCVLAVFVLQAFIQCEMSNSYKVQQKCWMHPLKIMILFAWSWSTNIIYSEFNNKLFFQSSWFLLCTFEMPVTQSPTV